MLEDDELLRAAKEQARVASLASPQQPRRQLRASASPCNGSSQGWQAKRIRAQDRVIAELQARLRAKAPPSPGVRSPPRPPTDLPAPSAAARPGS
eukprot:431846-Alexandrium_andersonii.AAC.1